MLVQVRRLMIAGLIPVFGLVNACSEKKAEEPVAAPTPADEVPAAPAAPAAPEAPEAPTAPEATEAPVKKKTKTVKKKAKKPVKK